MNIYAKLKNGELEYAPFEYRTESGGIIVNFNKNVNLMKAYGYKEVVDVRPSHNADTQYLQISEYFESESQITVVYRICEIEDVGKEPTLRDRVDSLEKMDVDLVATTWEMDFRICEVEWYLEDTIMASNEISNIKKLKLTGGNAMALSRFEQAKIMILGGAYNRTTLERQLKRYLEKGEIAQSEFDTLISMMDAKEMVTEEI